MAKIYLQTKNHFYVVGIGSLAELAAEQFNNGAGGFYVEKKNRLARDRRLRRNKIRQTINFVWDSKSRGLG